MNQDNINKFNADVQALTTAAMSKDAAKIKSAISQFQGHFGSLLNNQAVTSIPNFADVKSAMASGNFSNPGMLVGFLNALKAKLTTLPDPSVGASAPQVRGAGGRGDMANFNTEDASERTPGRWQEEQDQQQMEAKAPMARSSGSAPSSNTNSASKPAHAPRSDKGQHHKKHDSKDRKSA
jgi:hypothetical protein